MATRSDPEKHRSQVRAANRARYKAIQRLIAENQERFDAFYAEEAVVEGVEPKPRRFGAAALQGQIAELEQRLAQMRQHESA